MKSIKNKIWGDSTFDKTLEWDTMGKYDHEIEEIFDDYENNTFQTGFLWPLCFDSPGIDLIRELSNEINKR